MSYYFMKCFYTSYFQSCLEAHPVIISWFIQWRTIPFMLLGMILQDQSYSLCLGNWASLANHTFNHLHPSSRWEHDCLWVITNCPSIILIFLTLEPGWVPVTLPWGYIFIIVVLLIGFVLSFFSLILWLFFKFCVFALTSYWIIKAFHIKRNISKNVWIKKKSK